jgi:hypothetical protein
MKFQFRKHYTLDEARALLPEIRLWLKRMAQLQNELAKNEERLNALFTSGQDLGGDTVNAWLRNLADIKDVFGEFRSREIQVKDIARGLIDFPALIGGKEVFLCWEQDEPDIEYWHDLDTGYAGREPL